MLEPKTRFDDHPTSYSSSTRPLQPGLMIMHGLDPGPLKGFQNEAMDLRLSISSKFSQPDSSLNWHKISRFTQSSENLHHEEPAFFHVQRIRRCGSDHDIVSGYRVGPVYEPNSRYREPQHRSVTVPQPRPVIIVPARQTLPEQSPQQRPNLSQKHPQLLQDPRSLPKHEIYPHPQLLQHNLQPLTQSGSQPILLQTQNGVSPVQLLSQPHSQPIPQQRPQGRSRPSPHHPQPILQNPNLIPRQRPRSISQKRSPPGPHPHFALPHRGPLQEISRKTGRPKRKPPPLTGTCTVCSDASAEYNHYGGMVCFSCRQFFR